MSERDIDIALATARWFKSTHSDEHGGACVEAAHLPGRTAVHDSKNPAAGHLVFANADWKTFTNQVRTGAYDL